MLRSSLLTVAAPLALLGLVTLGSCSDTPATPPVKMPARAWSDAPLETIEKEKTFGGEQEPATLVIDIFERGTGKVAARFDTVSVHYTGWVKDTEHHFDSSHDRGRPFSFPLGQGRVIGGWDLGLDGMTVGTRARLHIPWQLGYGIPGNPPVIPGKADLVFDVELVAVR